MGKHRTGSRTTFISSCHSINRIRDVCLQEESMEIGQKLQDSRYEVADCTRLPVHMAQSCLILVVFLFRAPCKRLTLILSDLVGKQGKNGAVELHRPVFEILLLKRVRIHLQGAYFYAWQTNVPSMVGVAWDKVPHITNVYKMTFHSHDIHLQFACHVF